MRLVRPSAAAHPRRWVRSFSNIRANVANSHHAQRTREGQALCSPTDRMAAVAHARQTMELCAVPKKKVSLHKRKLRRNGQRGQTKPYVPYFVCLGCQNPVRLTQMCMECKDATKRVDLIKAGIHPNNRPEKMPHVDE